MANESIIELTSTTARSKSNTERLKSHDAKFDKIETQLSEIKKDQEIKIEKVSDQFEQRIKSQDVKFDKMETQIDLLHEMNSNIALIAAQTNHTQEHVEEVRNFVSSELRVIRVDVDTIKYQPIKKWEKLKWIVISSVVTLLITSIGGAFLYLVLRQPLTP